MTWSRRYFSASAWGSSRVLMIGPAPGGGRGHPLPDVLGPLAQAEHRPPGRLEHLAGAGVGLPAHQERDEHLGVVGEVVPPAGQVVLVAAVGVAGRVGVVLEQVDVPADALLPQPGLGPLHQRREDPLPRLVVGDQLGDGVALRGGVLGMAAHVEVEPGPVLEEDVGGAAPADHPPEEVAGHLVGAQPPLPAQGAGDPVLVLQAVDTLVHHPHGTVETARIHEPAVGGRGRRPGSLSPAGSPVRRPPAGGRPVGRCPGPGRPPRDPSRRGSGRDRPERAHRRPQRLGQGPVPRPLLLEPLGDGLGLPAQHGVAVLVGDGPLVGDVVQLVRSQPGAQLGHQDLDLERLHLVGEHLAEVLGVEVGQRTGVDVLAAVGVALGVGVADTRDPQLVELVVLAHAGEGDPVVDLADLVEGPGRDSRPRWRSPCRRRWR